MKSLLEYYVKDAECPLAKSKEKTVWEQYAFSTKEYQRYSTKDILFLLNSCPYTSLFTLLFPIHAAFQGI